MINDLKDATAALMQKVFKPSSDEQTATLKRIAVLVDNIEQIYHQNFLSGMNSSLYKIKKKCRAEYSDLLSAVGIEDTIIKEDRDKPVQKQDSILPTIYLHFHPTDLNDAIDEEQREFITKRNEDIQNKVDFINSCKADINHDILALKREYLTESDGFLFKLSFDSFITHDLLIDRIDFIIGELEKLSLDAAVVMFNQIEWISIVKANPFIDFVINEQEIGFTFIDLKNHLPSRSILYFLKSFKYDVEKSFFESKNNHSKVIDFQKRYNEENGSFLKINLRIQ